jgi:hypothetical protein
MTLENAFCFGNGKSRLDFDMKVIEGRGTTFGCNAIYRDMKVDHLVTVDNEITHEIYRSGYCMDNHTHIRDWNVLPMYFLDDMKNDYPDADIHVERDDIGFVIHGSNTADVEAHFQKIVQENPDIDIKKLEWERKQVKTFITGVKEDDLAKTIENDRMQSCGVLSIQIACEMGARNVFIIGHDLYSKDKKLNNVYGGTTGYLPETANYVKPDNWIVGHKTNFDKYPEVQFYKVNKDVLGTNDTCCFVEQWRDCQNLQYITQEEVQRLLDFGWMM